MLVPNPLMLVDPFFFKIPRRAFHAAASHYYTSENLWFLYELMLAVLQGSYPIPVPSTRPQPSKQVL